MTAQKWPDYRYTSPDGRRWAALTDDVVESEENGEFFYAQWRRSDQTVRYPGSGVGGCWAPIASYRLSLAQAAFTALLPPLGLTVEAPKELTPAGKAALAKYDDQWVLVPKHDLHRILQSFVAHSHAFIGSLNRKDNPRIARDIVALEEEIALAHTALRNLEGSPCSTVEPCSRPVPSTDTLKRWTYTLWQYFNSGDADAVVDERMSLLHQEIASFAQHN